MGRPSFVQATPGDIRIKEMKRQGWRRFALVTLGLAIVYVAYTQENRVKPPFHDGPRS